MDLARFTACSIPFIKLPLDQALDAILAAGFTRVDLLGRTPHFSVDQAQVSVEQVEASFASREMQVANLGTYLGRDFGSADPAKVQAEMRDSLLGVALARRLGARTARVLPGQGEDPAQIPRLAPHFAELARAAEEAGIYLVMENHAGSLAGNAELAVQLCEAVGSQSFGIIYEPCNLLLGKRDPMADYATMRHWVRHVHLKDGRWVAGKFEGTHLGAGDVRIAEVLSLLSQDGYRGDFAVEYEVPELEPPETGLARWRDWLIGL